MPQSWRNLSREEIAQRISQLPPEKRKRLATWARRRKEKRIWEPFPGPQTEAFHCNADVIGFGGAGGGGKTDLALGRALKRHRKISFYRRTYPTLGAAIERSREILRLLERAKAAKYSEVGKRWQIKAKDGYPMRRIRFGAMQYEKDKENYRGNDDDLKVFDEAQNFTQSQIRFVLGWLRTSVPGQICTALLTFNPPTTAEGQWIIEFFAPWLDEKHPNPAKPGEWRWFAMIDGVEVEVPSGEPFEHTPKLADGSPGKPEIIKPKSRTFFRALVEDNPAYMATGYRDVLAALPEPLRSQMLKGDFTVGLEDDAWQVIPTAWVKLAMARGNVTHRPIGPDGRPLPWRALGADVAAGGTDLTVFARRVDDWYGPLISYPGKETPTGNAAAARLVEAMEGATGVSINIDAIGIGQGLRTALEAHGVKFEPVNVAAGSYGTEKTGSFKFANLKAEIYWRMREALDPENGRNVCLPDDRELLADLCAPHWSLTASGIEIERKEKTKKRTAVGLHKGEAVMLCNYIAPQATSTKNPWGNR